MDEEEGTPSRKSTLSDALQDLVERLAARLQEESDSRLAAIAEECAAQEKAYAKTEAQLKHELGEARASAAQLETRLHTETDAHMATRQAQQVEAIARHTAEQHSPT